jgi:putative ABC transport system permease protein
VSAVTRQVRANLRRGRLQSVLVVLTVLAASALLAVALVTFGAAGGAYERLHDRVDGAHVWLDLDPSRVTTDHVAGLRELPGVVDLTEPRTSVASTLRDGDERFWVLLRDWPGADATIARTLVVEGREPAADETGVLALDRNLARHHELELGDEVDVLTEGGWSPLEIVALTVAADMCPAPLCEPQISHLSSGGLAATGLAPAAEAGVERLSVGLRLADPTAHETVATAARDALPPGAVVLTADHEMLGEFADFGLRIQSVFLIAFGLVAAVAAGFLIGNAIADAVRGQTRQIGLLKAVGFTRRQLAATYLAQYLGLTAVASVVGVAAGAVIARAVLAGVADQFGGASLALSWWLLATIPVAVVVLAALFTLLPVRRAAGVDVVSAVRTGAVTAGRRPARLRRLPLPLATAVVELRARPARTVLTVAALSLAAATLAFASLGTTTIDRMTTDRDSGLVAPADLTLAMPPTMQADDVRALLAAQEGVAAVREQSWVWWSVPGESASFGSFAVAGDVDAFHVPMLEGERPAAAGEAIVGYGLADERGLSPGDRFAIEISGATVDLEVTGIYREMSNLGKLLTTPAATIRAIDPDLAPDVFLLAVADGVDPAVVTAGLAEASAGVLDARPAVSFADPVVGTLPAVMAVLVSVLVAIGLLGVFNSVWIGVQERGRELGLLKAVGMRGRQIVASVLAGAALVGVAGFAVGVPLGFVGTRALLDALGRNLGFGPLPTYADAGQLALALPVVVSVALAGAAIPARRAARLPVAEALRTE